MMCICIKTSDHRSLHLYLVLKKCSCNLHFVHSLGTSKTWKAWVTWQIEATSRGGLADLTLLWLQYYCTVLKYVFLIRYPDTDHISVFSKKTVDSEVCLISRVTCTLFLAKVVQFFKSSLLLQFEQYNLNSILFHCTGAEAEISDMSRLWDITALGVSSREHQ